MQQRGAQCGAGENEERYSELPSMQANALWTEKEMMALVVVRGAEDVLSWMGWRGTRQSLKKLPLPSQTMGTIEHGSSAKRRFKT